VTQPGTSAEDFLMGGSKTRSARWGGEVNMGPKEGSIEHGIIVEEPVVLQQQRYNPGKDDHGELLWWDDAKTRPRQQLAVKIQTDHHDDDDDDGIRAIYIKGLMQKTVKDAVIAAKAKKLEVGGHLYVKFDHSEKDPKSGFRTNYWQAKYEPPAVKAAEDFFGTGANEPASPGGFAPSPSPSSPAGTPQGGMLSRLQQQQATGVANIQGAIDRHQDDDPPF
jgi:hypothetical protein